MRPFYSHICLLLAVICLDYAQSAPSALSHCSPTAYVRAPDLQAGSTHDGQAKLVLRGSGCSEVVKWELGLRLQERAIYRFWRPNATLPEEVSLGWLSAREPGTCEDLYDSETAAYAKTPAILDVFGFLRNRACLAPEQTKYLRALANRDIWDIEVAERVVFDSRTALAMTADDATLIEDDAFYAIRNFSVHVPDTIRAANDYWSDRGDDLSAESSYVETMFEYYFLLTTKNGSTIDIPAGRTAFEPQRATFAEAEIREREERARSSEVRSIDIGPAPMARDSPSPKPACDANRTGAISAKVIAPAGSVQPGDNVTVTVELSQSGNSTAFIDNVLVSLRTCQVHAWAHSNALTANQRRETDGCTGITSTWAPDFAAGAGESALFIDHGDLLHQSKSMEELCGGGSDKWQANGERLRKLRKGIVAQSRNATHVMYQPLSFELRIPHHMMPAMNTTFASYSHLFDVRVETLYACDEGGEAASPEVQRKLDLRSDATWTNWYTGEKNEGRTRRTLYGSTPVKIVTQSPTSLKHYTDADADAIYLTSTGNVIGQPSKVGTEWRTDFADAELGISNYEIYWRMPSSTGYREGSAMWLVSEIQAKQGCAEWFRLQNERKENAEQSLPATDEITSQKVFS